MKIFLFLSIIFLYNQFLVQAVVFEGSCPSLSYVNSTFSCSANITSGSYRIAAFLPVAGDTLNIFYNPFELINCLDIGISCSYAWGRNVQLRYNCYPTMNGNNTSGIVTQCVPLTFDPYRYESGGNQISTFGFGLQLICRDKLVDFKTTLIFDENNAFLGIFGCRDLPDNQHEEGAWVVATTSKDLPNSNDVLSAFRHAVSYVSKADLTDFQVNDFSSEHSCTCSQCTYGMECPIEPKEEDDYSYYNYYDGVNYDYYPQYDSAYDDYYSHQEEEVPPEEDQPVQYYYYYDENYNYADYYSAGNSDYYQQNTDLYGDAYNYDYGNHNKTHNGTQTTTETIHEETKTSTWATTGSDGFTTEGSFVTDTTVEAHMITLGEHMTTLGEHIATDGGDFTTVHEEYGYSSTENYEMARNDTME